MTVLVVSAVAVGIATALLQQNILFSKKTITVQSGIRAEAYAEACLETALLRLRVDGGYGGNETIAFNHGDCAISVIGITQPRIVLIEGRSADARKRLRAEVSTTTGITVLRQEYVPIE
jgi:hypothetical protein